MLERLVIDPTREFTAHAPDATFVASRLASVLASGRPFAAEIAKALLLECLERIARARTIHGACQGGS